MKQEKFPFERIPAPLISWYNQCKRTLPWRENPTPYRVWVSEIMLQQTRVEAVKEYYARFLAALPTVQTLAECPEEKLLKLWEGLGYYSRVRNMQKAARSICREYGGEFPTRLEELKALAGIGSYTAGAIASIAFGKPTAAVDGNVFRVMARLEENDSVISDLKYRKYLEEELSAVYPDTPKGCSDFTQSLFELGALVCKPQTPDCNACPLKGLCRAFVHGRQRDYPVLPQKREKRKEQVFVFLIETPEGFCIRRREEGVLKGMNEFPSFVQTCGEMPEDILRGWGIDEFEEVRRKPYRHIFTHIVWEMTCIWVRTEHAVFDSYALDEIEESISLPTAFRQCLTMIKE